MHAVDPALSSLAANGSHAGYGSAAPAVDAFDPDDDVDVPSFMKR